MTRTDVEASSRPQAAGTEAKRRGSSRAVRRLMVLPVALLLAIALSVARRPQLLMVDELSLGLSPVATSSILDELSRAQREEQFAILLVDQAAGQISRFVDYYYLLEAGSIIGQGSAEEISVSQLRETVIGR